MRGDNARTGGNQRGHRGMTCGVCSPEMFRVENGGRLMGYCSDDTQIAVSLRLPDLYFMGAKFVVWDVSPSGQVMKRPGLKCIRKVLRRGDTLVISRIADLGTKLAYQKAAIRALEGDGIAVAFLTGECPAPT